MPADPTHETLGANLARRMRRLQIRRVQHPVLPWVIACWTLTLGIFAVTLVPGALAGITGEPVASADGLPGFDAPLWFRVLVTFAGAVVAGATVIVLKTRVETSLRGQIGLAGLLVLPVLGMLADQAWPFAAAAAVLAATAEVLMRLRVAVPRALPALAASATWLVALGYQFTETGGARESWLWIALFGGAAAFAAFGAYYGVARAAESRSRALRFLFRERWHPLAVLGVAVAAGAIVVLRSTVLRELFPAPDPQLWSPWARSPTSWALAALVVGVLVLVAVRSTRHPLLRVGQRRVTAGLAVLGNLQLVIAALLIVIGLVTAMVGTADVPQEWLAAVPVLKVAGVVTLGVAVALPVFRGTAARWLVVVAVLFLLPNTLAGAIGDRTGFAPTPAQVTMLLVVVALGLALLNLVRPTVRPSLIARFAIVPIVAVHAGWLLPVVWSQRGLALAVLSLVIGFLLLQPPAPRDNRTHSARLLTRAAMQVLGLGIGIVAAPSLLDNPAIVVLGLIWLSVVVVAALCFETVAREPAETELEPEPELSAAPPPGEPRPRA